MASQGGISFAVSPPEYPECPGCVSSEHCAHCHAADCEHWCQSCALASNLPAPDEDGTWRIECTECGSIWGSGYPEEPQW